MKKGFTLIELIAVVILLGIVGLITFPAVTGVINDSKDKAYNTQIEMIEEAGKRWGLANSYKLDEMTYEVIPVRDLISDGYITNTEEGILIDPRTNEELEGCVVVSYTKEYNQFEYKYRECLTEYTDNSGANKPELGDKLVPIKYVNDNWVRANSYEAWYDYDKQEWANAVVLKKGITRYIGDVINEDDIDLWYVWIPRYKYQLFNANNDSASEQLINIAFESGTATTGTVTCTTATNQTDADGNIISSSETCTNATNGNWYTHPAFTFGEEQLTGIWIGKFEVSTTDSTCNTSPSSTNCNKVSTVTIKPNVVNWRYTDVSNFFTSIQNMKTTYNLISYDSHMMKNMEWGAVAYLSHSKYGQGNTEVYINNSGETTNYASYTGRSGGNVGGSTGSPAYTAYGTYTYDGKTVGSDGTIGSYASNRTLGTKASTTGNIYGIYDMSGGAWEYVMGNMVNSSNEFHSSKAGFTTNPDSMYYDPYTYDNSAYKHSRGKLGDATKETLKNFKTVGNVSWYSDYGYFVGITAPWFFRGGNFSGGVNAGVFYFSNSGGASSYNSARAVLVSARTS